MEDIKLDHAISTVEFKLVRSDGRYLYTNIPPEPKQHDRIARVHSPFGDAVFAYHEYFAKLTKKKAKKVYKKNRKGKDRTAFDSQVEISVISSSIQDKLYKVKVFSTGLCSVPGVIKEDLSDFIEPSQVLRDYVADMFDAELSIEGMRTVTRNYSYSFGMRTPIRKLWKVMQRLTPPYVSVNIDSLYKYLCCPGIVWSDVTEVKLDIPTVKSIVSAFTVSNKKRSEKREMNSVKLKEDFFINLMNGDALAELYAKIIKIIRRINELSGKLPSNETLSKLAGVYLKHFVAGIKRIAAEEQDNIFPYLDDKITKVSVMFNGACIVMHGSGSSSIYGVGSDIAKEKIARFMFQIKGAL